MRAEYLLFDLLVAAGPVALSLLPRAQFGTRARSLLWSILAVAPLFVVWDALVVGRHWWFDPRYTLGVTVAGLPVEEWLFFVVVPYGCVFAWETILHGARARPRSASGVHLRLGLAVAIAGLVAAAFGREYTALALGAAALSVGLDWALGTALLVTPRAWLFAGLVTLLTGVFNGYLTARPVVHYAEAYQLGVTIGTIPVEDFVYGLALVGGVLSVFSWHQGRAVDDTWLTRLIRARLQGFRVRVHQPDPRRPASLSSPRRVAVVGGGLAGLSAAHLLAKRGFDVVVYEKQPHLGGKIGAWRERLADGSSASVEHGFHAFFGHYYNLDAWLSELRLDDAFADIDDYVILTRDGRRLGFGTQRRAPVANLIDLGRRGMYRFADVLKKRTAERLRPMLEYDRDRTFAELDAVTFEEFAAAAALPRDLRLVFNAFARAFFASADRLSVAELVKSFHFYYLSHDLGLGYRYLDGGYVDKLLTPIEDRCRMLGVRFERGVGVSTIERRGERLRVRGETFDHVVLATDVRATRRILAESDDLSASDPALAAAVASLRSGQRYAVLRLWLTEPSPTDVPVFVSTERRRALDAVAFIDRIDPDTTGDARGVVELHCYAADDAMSDVELVQAMRDDLAHYFPALAAATVLREHVQIRDDFTAFHVGQHQHRPPTTTAVPGLVLAGDWVRLPVPAMLMEAAHTSARYAVNAICDEVGLRTEPIDSVPLRGLLARRSVARDDGVPRREHPVGIQP